MYKCILVFMNFSNPFSPTSHFMKIHQAGLELLQVDQWSDSRHSEAVMCLLLLHFLL